MMEAVRTSVTSVYYNETTLRNIPEGSTTLHTPSRDNLKSHIVVVSMIFDFIKSSFV
jgi:hypothetical protein